MHAKALKPARILPTSVSTPNMTINGFKECHVF